MNNPIFWVDPSGLAATVAVLDILKIIGEVFNLAGGVGLAFEMPWETTLHSPFEEQMMVVQEAHRRAETKQNSKANAGTLPDLANGLADAAGQIASSIAVPAGHVIAEEWAVSLRTDNTYRYFPAVRAGGAVWVGSVGLSRTEALKVVRSNNTYLGIMALTSADARGLAAAAGGGVDGPERGGIGSGFWSHYHSRLYRDAHIWFMF